MRIKGNKRIGVIALVSLLLIVAGNAWGYGVSPGSGGWGWGHGHDSSWDKDWSGFSGWSGGGMMDDDSDSAGGWGHGSSRDWGHGSSRDKDWSGFSGWFGGGMMDDDSDSAGGPGSGLGHGWDLGRGGMSGHPWWREFLLGDYMDGSGWGDWFKKKKKMWAILALVITHIIEHHHHDYPPPPAIPLPAPLLLFASGLVGLAGFLRRSRRKGVARD